MTPAEIERLYESVMLAAPMAGLALVLLILLWLWPNGRVP